MAALSSAVWWFAGALLLWSPQLAAADTCEDLNTINLNMEQSSKKLQQHDVRESHHWSELNNTLTALNSNNSDLGPVKDLMSRMGERLNNLENLLLKEERENKIRNETNEAFQGLLASVQNLTFTVESLVNKDSRKANVTKDDSLERRLDTTDSKIDDIKNQMKNLSNCNKENPRSECQKLKDTILFENLTSNAEKLLKKYELKLVEYNGNTLNISDFALADDVVKEIKRQGEEITRIQKKLFEAGIMWKELPKLSHFNDLQVETNQTLDAVIRATERLNENSEASMANLTREVRQLSARLAATNESILSRVVQNTAVTGRVVDDMFNELHALKTQVQSLMRSEKVIFETADNVKTTKRSIEYAANRVLAQVGRLVAQLGTSVNDTLDYKLKKMETFITSNQTASNSELDSKIVKAMTHMWRQIGAMHDQLRTGQAAVTLLTERTDKYVDSSTKTMINLKDDVSLISRRTLALSDNLNEALVKLRGAMDEFERMTGGLGDPMASLLTDITRREG